MNVRTQMHGSERVCLFQLTNWNHGSSAQPERHPDTRERHAARERHTDRAAPAEAKPGAYAAQLEVSAKEGGKLQFPVTLTIYPFTLERPAHSTHGHFAYVSLGDLDPMEIEDMADHGMDTIVCGPPNDAAGKFLPEKMKEGLEILKKNGFRAPIIIDTGFAVQMVQSADILTQDVRELRQAIAAKARQHQFTPMIGRSHGIHAEPTTFGLKLALMYDEFGRALQRLEAAKKAVAVASSPARWAPARTSRRRLKRRSAASWGCGRRPLPRRSSSATSMPSSSARWR
jgi:hypothetical protein